MTLESDRDKYDHSSHSTQRPEPGDLNAPGQLNEDGQVGPAKTDERPHEKPPQRD